MRDRSKYAAILVGLSLTGLTAMGCQESQPSNYQQNMGTVDAPLLAIGNARTIAAVASGQAEWVEFRQPEDTVEQSPEASAEDVETTAESEQVKQEIRELVEDFNKTAADRNLDETLSFFIDSQQASLKPVIQSMFEIADRLSKQVDSLLSRSPDDAGHMALALASLGPVAHARLEVTSIELVGDDEAIGTLPSGSLAETCRFTVEDDAWYLSFEDDWEAQSADVLDVLDQLLDSTEKKELSADDTLAAIEKAVADMKP